LTFVTKNSHLKKKKGCLIELHFPLIFRQQLKKKSYTQLDLQLIPTSCQSSTTRAESVAKCHTFPKKKRNTALKSISTGAQYVALHYKSWLGCSSSQVQGIH
jgi:hypothetical protein